MKKLLLVGLIGFVLASCSTRTGHVTGVLGRTVYQPEIPLGMVYIPAGSYNMGENDQDVPFLHQTHSKTVSVQAFYMDQTEITNNEYRQFVNWVRDSIAREKIYAGLEDDDEASKYINYTDEYFDEAGSEIVPFEPSDRDINRSTSDPNASLFSLNWDRDFDYQDADIIPLLVDMYYPQQERFFKRREIDTRKLNYRYYWIDLREAARRGRVEIVPNGYDNQGNKVVPAHRELNTPPHPFTDDPQGQDLERFPRYFVLGERFYILFPRSNDKHVFLASSFR